MNKSISLVVFNEDLTIEWGFGKKYSIGYDTTSLSKVRNQVLEDTSEFILFWDAKNILPTERLLKEILNSKGNLWHIGSKIGLKNRPKLLDAIQPTNMLHVPIDNFIDHSSWKNTFKGCLLEKRVFHEVELSNYSNSLDIIGLDFGHKAMKKGVITRYSAILSESVRLAHCNIKKSDELLFIRNNFDTKAFIWSYLMNALKMPPYSFLKMYKRKEKIKNSIFDQVITKGILKDKDISVSVVIATLERYSFLEKELGELRLLSPGVKEIIIVDQTPKEKRNKEFLDAFVDLPIVYIETDKIGQCTSRNRGIEIAKSKFIWFLDDDMEEIPENYLEKHLETMYSFDADISCGVPDEIGTSYVDRSIPKIEMSDGFPTNDVLVKRDLLIKVHGFDVKMDQKQSEDEELGLRCIKAGALSVKNNKLRIVHLRAARGGLRNHNVRKVTFSSSRDSLFQRRFLHHSEIYLKLKHFTRKQVYKSLLLNVRGTFIIRGNIFKKLAKIFFSIFLLPHTLIIISRNFKLAKKLKND